MIRLLAERLGGRAFDGHVLAAVVLDDPRLSAVVGAGEDFDADAAIAWLRRTRLPPTYQLDLPTKRRPIYRLTGPGVPFAPGAAGETDPERVVAAAAPLVEVLGAVYPRPFAGSEVVADLRHARRAPPSERRARLLALAAALRKADPLGAVRPHPVLRVLWASGLVQRLTDRRTGQVLWAIQGRAALPEHLHRIAPPRRKHQARPPREAAA